MAEPPTWEPVTDDVDPDGTRHRTDRLRVWSGWVVRCTVTSPTGHVAVSTAFYLDPDGRR